MIDFFGSLFGQVQMGPEACGARVVLTVVFLRRQRFFKPSEGDLSGLFHPELVHLGPEIFWSDAQNAQGCSVTK